MAVLRSGRRLVLPALLVLLATPAGPPEPEIAFEGPRPALDEALRAAADTAAGINGLHGFLASFRGRLVVEEYFEGYRSSRPHNIKSASKSVLSALIGIAVEQGVIPGVQTPIVRYFPRVLQDSDPRKRDITVEHLLTMRSGLERTSGRNYGAWVSSPSWVGYALQRPLLHPPGEAMDYSTGSTHLLAALLTKAAGESVWSFGQRNLAEPLGFELAQWPRDPEGYYFGGNDMAMTPRQMLTFGELYRRGGVTADGERVLSQDWVDRTFIPRGRSDRSGRLYGYGWWIRRLAGRDVGYAWGYGGQFIFVVPDLELTVVTTSSTDSDSRGGRNSRIYALTEALIESIAASDAFPRRARIPGRST